MDTIAVHAASRPDRPALIEGDRTLTWAEYAEGRNRLANALVGAGLAPGERVVVWAPNSIEYLLVSAASAAAGAISVPMNHRLTAGEAAYILDDSDAVAVFVDDAHLAAATEARAASPGVRLWILTGRERRPWAEHIDDLIASGSPEPVTVRPGGQMIYTSGTTGKPKGAVRTRLDPMLALAWMQAFDLADPDHVHLVAGPLYHSAPGAFAAMTQAMGGTCVIMRRFDAEAALALVERHRCTTTFMAPILLKRILGVPAETRTRYDTSSLRVITVAGAPCPNPVKEATIEAFGPVLYEFYGSTELAINTILRPEDVLRKPGSCGRAAYGVEIAILDPDGKPVPTGETGELHVRRYGGMFDGYHKKPGGSEEEWVSVGDVAYLDEEGFVYICDRVRDMVISGGVNIYPAEIEDVFHRHPDVADIAVFGVPDDDWGERLHAAVLFHPGRECTEGDLKAYARGHLADYKVPGEFSFPAELPRDNAGKLLKRVLREPFWAGRGTRV
jgi:acyl-CoA synthetase (AMP-forming)/AMP-acid ligase II